MTEHTNKRQERPPAEVYDDAFVPALFGPWAHRVADLAGLGPGQDVLDVACGTGALTRAAAARVVPGGSVVGLDPNDDMLCVARGKEDDIEWTHGYAESLPFDDARFDGVVSQFGMMFFEDPRAALREMMRVLRPRGRLTVAVCDAIDHSAGYAVLTELLHRLFGEPVARAFRAPFALGNRRELHAIAAAAELPSAGVTRHEGLVRFDSIAALVSTERACAWTLGGMLEDAQFARLLTEAEESLRPFVTKTGSIEFAMPALVVTAQKP